MYSIRFLFLIFSGTILFSSCNENADREKQTGKNDSVRIDSSQVKVQMQYVRGFDFSIMVGPRLSLTEGLSADAILQYQDYEGELYIVIAEEKKSAFDSIARKEKRFDESKTLLKNFAETRLAATRNAMKLKAEPGQTAGEIGGMKSEIYSFSGRPQGMDLDVYYKVAFIDSGEKIFTVMVWTLDDYKPKNLVMIDRMLFSFRKEQPVLSK